MDYLMAFNLIMLVWITFISYLILILMGQDNEEFFNEITDFYGDIE
jgi:hypothetical protein